MRLQKISAKDLTQAGLEPTISCSVGRRLIHWATEPWCGMTISSNIYLYIYHVQYLTKLNDFCTRNQKSNEQFVATATTDGAEVGFQIDSSLLLGSRIPWLPGPVQRNKSARCVIPYWLNLKS